MKTRTVLSAVALCAAAMSTLSARADVVNDWNAKAEAIGIEKALGAPINGRQMTILHIALFEAVNAVDKRYAPYNLRLTADRETSKEAAAASAAYNVLVTLHPDKKADLDALLAASLAKVADESAKAKGVELGRQAAAGIVALRANDGALAPETYRPVTTPGTYIPTVIPIASMIATTKPWVMSAPSQFRAPAPPALTSQTWTDDLNEIREYGGRQASKRTAEQTEIGRFWFMTGPRAWNPMVRQLADAKNLDINQRAHLFALVAMAGNDALIAVFDAKYHYNLWRPLTAIRNADQTGNPNTPREASWLPLGETPMHPEYPCAHCISSTAVGTVLQSTFGNDIPEVTMTSTTLPGVTRRWSKVSDYMEEVSMARIYGGFHYRFSTKVGNDMGKKIADLVTSTQLLGASASAVPAR